MRGSLSTRRERWARLGRHLWQPPRPHGEQPDERVVGPLELFYDLVVVVLVAQARTRAHGAAFAIAASVLFAVLAVLWLLAARGDRPEYRLPARCSWRGRRPPPPRWPAAPCCPPSARVPAWGLLEVGYLTGYTLIITAPARSPRAWSPAR